MRRLEFQKSTQYHELRIASQDVCSSNNPGKKMHFTKAKEKAHTKLNAHAQTKETRPIGTKKIQPAY